MGQQDIIGCFIPECFNTSEDPPGKRFARVPCLPKLRQLWIKAGLRLKVKVPLVDKSPMYCCEDHFNLHKDATSQWLSSNDQYDKGNFIKLKRGILPHIFPSKSKEYVKSPRKKILQRRVSTNKHEKLKHELEQKLDLIDLTDSHESTSITVDTIDITQDEPEDVKANGNSTQNESDNPEEQDCGKEQEKETDVDKSNRTEIILDIESKKDKTKNVSKVNHEQSSEVSQNDKDMLKEESENPKELHQEEETVLGKKDAIEEDKEDTLTTKNRDDASKEEIENVITVNSPIQNFEKNLLRGKRKIKKRPRKMSISQQLPDEGEECLLKGQANQEQIETDETKSKKKRTVVKEILAWIPSNTSNLPMNSPMQQPFLMLPTSTFPGLGVPGLQFPGFPSTQYSNLNSTPLPTPAENDTQYVVSSTESNSPQVQNEENSLVNFKEVTTEIRSLKETMESLNKELTLLRSDNVTLKDQNTQIIENGKKEEVKHAESKRLEIATESLRPWFTPNQVTYLLDKPEDKCKINWNNSEMDNAAKLYNISPQAYKYVLESLKYPFPSITSVKKYIEKTVSNEKDPPWRECTNYELFNESEDSDEGLVESMLEQYNSKELDRDVSNGHKKWKPTTSMAEQDTETIEVEETLIKVSKNDTKLGTSSQPLKIQGRKCEESPLTQDGMEKPPKIIRVPVQHSKGKNKGNISSKMNLNEVLTTNNYPQKIPPIVKPKIVKVGPPVNIRKTPSEFRNIKTKLKEVVRARKEMKGSSIDVPQVLKQNTTTSIERETVLKNTSKNVPRSYSVTLTDNSIEKQPEKKNYLADEVLNYNHESIPERFIVNHDYHENTDKRISQVIMNEGVNIGNVPQIITSEDGSKVIRLQVNSLPGEDPTLYEEVVIHCDDPTIFDNEVVSLSFSHDDAMVDTAFL